MSRIIDDIKIRATNKFALHVGLQWRPGRGKVNPIIDSFSDCDFESEVNQFRGFLHRLAFPVFSTRFLDRFFHLQHIYFTENIYRILIKQTGHKTTTFVAPQRLTFCCWMSFYYFFLEFWLLLCIPLILSSMWESKNVRTSAFAALQIH